MPASRGTTAVNDVVPDGSGGWIATCECGDRARFSEQEAAWRWVLTHPCPADG